MEIEPLYSGSYVKRGRFKYETGDVAGAFADYNTAVGFHPKTPDSYIERGILKFKEGDFPGAVTDLNAGIEFAPSRKMVLIYRGMVQEQMGDLAGALKDYRAVLKLNDDDPRSYARVLIWLVQTRAGKKELANRELANCLDKWKSEVTADDAAIFKFLLDRMTESDFLHVLSADLPDQSRTCAIWYYIGMKRLFAGDKKGAAEALRTSVSTNKKVSIQYHAAKAELRALDHS